MVIKTEAPDEVEDFIDVSAHMMQEIKEEGEGVEEANYDEEDSSNDAPDEKEGEANLSDVEIKQEDMYGSMEQEEDLSDQGADDG